MLASLILCYAESGLSRVLQEYLWCLQILLKLFSKILSARSDGIKEQETYLVL